ncbi:MAG: BMP family ABC transporter substrate-binding protein [Desulfovibrio sp.]|nr:BMP family ABC transporter substrate-binding protein [Desulfovibrio sp.]
MHGDKDEDGWNASQYNGIKVACALLDADLDVRDNVREASGATGRNIQELIDSGCTMIFLCTYTKSAATRAIIAANPHIAFVTNSADIQNSPLTSCFIRMYQARFLAGALAGLESRKNRIGYIAAFPNSEVIRGLNAFALGVQATNPKALVYVSWTNSWSNPQTEAEHAHELLLDRDVDLLAYHQAGLTIPIIAEKAGIPFIGYNAQQTLNMDHALTTIQCRWDIYYYEIIQHFMKGELKYVKNHWVGFDREIITLSPLSERVSKENREIIDELRFGLSEKRLIFKGPIFDIKGNIRCKRGEVISDNALIDDMDWLVQGIIEK